MEAHTRCWQGPCHFKLEVSSRPFWFTPVLRGEGLFLLRKAFLLEGFCPPQFTGAQHFVLFPLVDTLLCIWLPVLRAGGATTQARAKGNYPRPQWAVIFLDSLLALLSKCVRVGS